MNCLYSLAGTINSYRGRGTELGFPTLNFPAPPDIQDGVYAGYCLYQQQRLPSAVFVGAAITFGETNRQVEVHILDRSIVITGTIVVKLMKYIRPNHQFNRIADLKKQIEQDLIAIRQCLPELSKIK